MESYILINKEIASLKQEHERLQKAVQVLEANSLNELNVLSD
jgi:hypothetical protein